MKATEKYEILNEAKNNDNIEELTGFNFVNCEFPKNGIDYQNAIVMEDEQAYFIDLGMGCGFAQYNKSDFTLDKAIQDATND